MKNRFSRLTALGMLTALVVVLQTAATSIRFGSFPITLTLIPIVVAGALYGVGSGALIGTVFGLVVLVMVLTGADSSGQMMLALHPLITSAACVVKGTLCGAAAAAVYRLVSRRSERAAVVAAAAVCPLVNTGVLYLVLVLVLFFDTSWAAVLSAFMSVNFLLELAVNIVLAPAVLRIVTMRRRAA